VPVIDTQGASAWRATSSPDPDVHDLGSGLYGVSCLTGSPCVAAGAVSPTPPGQTTAGTEGIPAHPLLEQLTSAGWRILPQPSGNPPNSGLASVSCAATTCVAVGVSGNAVDYDKPLYALITQST
jgi:hypothetical protein